MSTSEGEVEGCDVRGFECEWCAGVERALVARVREAGLARGAHAASHTPVEFMEK